MSTFILAGKYAERFGFSSVEAISLEDLFQILMLISKKNKGFFLLKVDGGRSGNIYTVVLNVSAVGVILRKDVECIEEGVMYIFSELEEKGIYP